MKKIEITLPLPPRELSPNARCHWSAKARATKRYKFDAYVMTIAAGGQNKKWTRAVAQATFYFGVNRKRDSDNALASLKAAFDGIVEAGLIIGDSADVLKHEPVIFDVDHRYPRVVICVEKRVTQ